MDPQETKSEIERRQDELTPQSNKRYRQAIDVLSESLEIGDLGMLTQFTPGKRIQVLWILADSDNEDAEERNVWWPATVVGRTNRLFDLPSSEDEEEEPGAFEKLPVYEIRYDPMLPDFPKPELSAVCILDDHHILDTEAEGNPTHPWRHDGSTWEPSEEEEEEESGELEHKLVPESLAITLETLRQEAMSAEASAVASPAKPNEDSATEMATKFVNELIESLTRKHQQELLSLPRANQNAIVDKVMKVKDMLVQKLACRLVANGEVSEEDARCIVDELRAA